jgi:hypothetical protein
MTKTEAMDAFRRLIALYGLKWTATTPMRAYVELANINDILTEADRRAALRGEGTETTTQLCVICSEPIDVQRFPKGQTWAGGHNPSPISDVGRCCTACNSNVVLPARMQLVTHSKQ